MPAPARFHTVDHMGCVKLDAVLVQGRDQSLVQPAVVGLAHRAVRTVGVDDHGDHPIRASSGGDLGEAADVLAQVH